MEIRVIYFFIIIIIIIYVNVILIKARSPMVLKDDVKTKEICWIMMLHRRSFLGHYDIIYFVLNIKFDLLELERRRGNETKPDSVYVL